MSKGKRLPKARSRSNTSTALMPPTCQNKISGANSLETKGSNLVNKLHSLFTLDAPNGANLLVVEQDTVKLI
jgi:hypothetical protein